MSSARAEVLARPARRGPPTRRPWETGAFAWTFFAVNALAVGIFWWTGSGDLPLKGAGDYLNSAGRLTGLAGTYLVLWQLLLMARVPWLDTAFGMERMVVLHRWNGYAAIGLLIAHAFLQTLGYAATSGLGIVGQTADFVNAYQGLLAAIAALVLLVLVVATSIGIARLRLAYETWYFIHLYTYLAIALAFIHEIAVGADFTGHPLFVAYWAALYALVFAALAGFRIGVPLVRMRKHGVRILRLEKEAPGVTSIYLGGERVDHLGIEAGQFMIWRFLDRDRWWQAHPFTISAPPTQRQIRLTVRNIGDFTARVGQLTAGTRVLLEGPFGSFTARECARAGAVLIAAGVGITPIRPLAEELAEEGKDVTVLYRCRSEQHAIFKAELDRMAARLGVRIEYLYNSGRHGRSALGAAALRELVPDIAAREAYVCGPHDLMEETVAALRSLGVPHQHVHTEVFRF